MPAHDLSGRMMKRALVHKLPFVLLIFVFVSCGSRHGGDVPVSLFGEGERLGTIDPRLREASGLVESAANPGMLWTHNDSGNSSDLFLIDKNAKVKSIFHLSARNRDWEDIATGKGPDPSKAYIYLGDIGDNLSNFEYKLIYRIEEPMEGDEAEIVDFDTLIIRLEDGSRDMETLMIDPLTNDIILVSKWEAMVHVYSVSYPFEGDTLTAVKQLELPITEIVAGDISIDGKEILLKSYTSVYYWRRASKESLDSLLSTEPLLLPYERERQGEAIAWARDGSGYYTLSEGAIRQRTSLKFYPRIR